jgi:hypothetical protein
MNKAFAAPLIAESATSRANGGVPVMNSAATLACAANASRSELTMIRYLGKRSASAPPKSRNTTCATDRPASTIPSRAAEPPGSPRTAKASATGAIDVPSRDTARARKMFRKAGRRISPRSRFLTSDEYAANNTA